MNVEEARRRLEDAADQEEEVGLPPSVLSHLTVEDVPDGVSFKVGILRDIRELSGGGLELAPGDFQVLHLEWSGRLYRDGSSIVGEADYTQTRKYWYSPLGLEQYMDLVRRAIETRHRIRGDVELSHYDDDGAFIQFHFSIKTAERNLGRAFDAVRKVADEVEEAAQQAADEVGKHIAEVAARLSGWGSESLDGLVEQVETSSSADDKGRSLEELCSRLLATVPGFSVTGRLRTATEEIDIAVLNDSPEPRLRREAALVVAECKNWTGKCGKDEFVLFRQKIENRNGRCSLGFLISWNGFAGTVTKEMLRGSREETLIVPITGADIRAAVRAGSFTGVLLACWEKAVSL